MKTVKTVFTNVMLCLLALVIFNDAHAATKNQCRAALVVNEVTELHFGYFLGSSAGSVRVSPTGARTTTGPILIGNSAVSPAVYSLHSTIAGCERFRFRVKTTNGNLGGPGSSMRVNRFRTDPRKRQIRLSPNANDPILVRVGADVRSATSQAAGTYTGTYSVDFQIR